MISEDLAVQNSTRHLRVLGICWVVFGILRLVAAVWLVSFTNTATMMFGALLNRVANPFAMMSSFHMFYTVVIARSVVCGVLGILAGIALLASQRAGRTIAIVAAVVSLSDIPLGLTLGVYSLVVLLPMPAATVSTVVVEDRASTLRHHPSTT